MPSLAELRKQKLAEQKETEIPITKKLLDVEKSKNPKKSKDEIRIKTDNFRTGISNITGSSKRDLPPILKQKLLNFLESHDLVQKSDKTWFWIKTKKVSK